MFQAELENADCDLKKVRAANLSKRFFLLVLNIFHIARQKVKGNWRGESEIEKNVFSKSEKMTDWCCFQILLELEGVVKSPIQVDQVARELHTWLKELGCHIGERYEMIG